MSANSMMDEIKPRIAGLPIGTKVVAFGFAGVEQIFCITGEMDENESQDMCLISGYYEDAYFSPKQKIDKYSSPLSKKFGIGFYWDDVENIVYPQSKVVAAMRRANYLVKKISDQENAKQQADKKEILELPLKFPHLQPLNGKNDDYNFVKANIVVDLKKNFPGVKFSVKKRGYDSININWTDGPSMDEVVKVTGKYESYENDWSGDFRDYSPSNFNKVFGGLKYVFEDRDMSSEIRELVPVLNAHWPDEYTYENEGTLRKVWWRYSFPIGSSNFRLERNDCTCGSRADFWDIKFDKKAVENVEKTEISVSNIEIVDYSDKSIAVIGETKAIKDKLKELGGRFNFRLTCGAGWIFSKKQESAVRIALSL